MFKTILIILFTMLLLDAVYLYFTKNMFSSMVVKIQKTAMIPRLEGGAVVYLLLAIGLYHFIIKPARPLWEAGLLGLVIYGTFDFTNYTMFKNYDIQVGIMDTLWGATLLTLTTAIVRLF
jgi:uncharacterized membrane protein